MSYILDALRRAEAERAAGAVPTLHTQAQPMPARDDDDRPPRRRAGWTLPLGAALAVLIAAGLWWTQGAETPSPAVARHEMPTPAPVAREFAPVMSSQPPPAPTRVPSAAPMSGPMPVPTPTAPAWVAQPMPGVPPREAQPVPATRPQAAPPTSAAPQRAMPPGPAAAVTSTAVSALPPATSTAPARLPRQTELADALRREIPPMAIGGSIFSPDRAARMVIIDGQVRREGDIVAPGLVVEQIGAKTAIFGFRGQRFEVPL